MGLFSMEGRYNRARYFWTAAAIWMVLQIFGIALGVAISLSADDAESARAAAGQIGCLLGLAAAAVIAFPAVKRFHDLNRPGTHYWLLLIPIYNIYLALLLLFKRGTEGENLYGPDPLAGR